MRVMPADTQGFQPTPGLSMRNFKGIAQGGFGDGHNNYAHSMAWFDGKLYVGTTRSESLHASPAIGVRNCAVLQVAGRVPRHDGSISTGSIVALRSGAYDPAIKKWEMVYRAPLVQGSAGGMVAREMGYRSMAVFQGESDPKPALYVAAWAPGRAPGGHILRSYDGRTFERVTRPGILEQPISDDPKPHRFRDRMFFSPTAQRAADLPGSQQNTAGLAAHIRKPRSGWAGMDESERARLWRRWQSRHLFARRRRGAPLRRHLQSRRACRSGRAIVAATPPYKWHKLLERGAGRGPAKSDGYVDDAVQGRDVCRNRNSGRRQRPGEQNRPGRQPS